MNQAPKGGCVGVNGDQYEGGQFLPNSEHTIKGSKKSIARKRAPRKVEIEPYNWVLAPVDQFAIFPRLAGRHYFNHDTNTFTENTRLNWNSLGMGGPAAREESIILIDRYNRGDRWV
jgi:hypothetical protein